MQHEEKKHTTGERSNALKNLKKEIISSGWGESRKGFMEKVLFQRQVFNV